MTTNAVVAPHALNLMTIYFRHSCCELNEDFNPQVANQKLLGAFRVIEGTHASFEAESVDPAGGIKISTIHRFVTSFEFKYIFGSEPPSDEESQDSPYAAKITASIAADYLASEGAVIDQPMIDSWGGGNVQLHVWPYWREFCASSMAKLNLPVTTLPLLSVSGPPAK